MFIELHIHILLSTNELHQYCTFFVNMSSASMSDAVISCLIRIHNLFDTFLTFFIPQMGSCHFFPSFYPKDKFPRGHVPGYNQPFHLLVYMYMFHFLQFGFFVIFIQRFHFSVSLDVYRPAGWVSDLIRCAGGQPDKPCFNIEVAYCVFYFFQVTSHCCDKYFRNVSC